MNSELMMLFVPTIVLRRVFRMGTLCRLVRWGLVGTLLCCIGTVAYGLLTRLAYVFAYVRLLHL